MREFIRRFTVLSYGNVAGQIAVAIASPILSRVFDPSDYGETGVVLSVAMLLSLVATMRYDDVIVAGRTAASRSNAVSLAMLVSAAVCAAMLLVILAALPLQRAFGYDHAVATLLLFAPVILFLSVTQGQILPVVLIQFERFRLVSVGQFVNAALGAASQIGLGLLGFGALGLLLGRTVGLVVSIAVMVIPSLRGVIRPVLGAARRSRMVRVLRGYRRQAYYLAPSGLFNVAAAQLPVLVLATSFDTAASGSFFFFQSVANGSLSIYRRSMTTLAQKDAQSLTAAGKPLMPFVLRLTALIGSLAVAGAATLFFFGEQIMPLIFGREWVQAGVTAKWMGFHFAATVIHMPAAGLTTLLRFQRSMLVMEACQFAVVTLALAIGTAYGDFEVTVALVGIATATVFCIHLAWIFRVVRASDLSRSFGGRPPPSDSDIGTPGYVAARARTSL